MSSHIGKHRDTSVKDYWNTFRMHDRNSQKDHSRNMMGSTTLKKLYDYSHVQRRISSMSPSNLKLVNRFYFYFSLFFATLDTHQFSFQLGVSDAVILALWFLCFCIVVSAPGGDAV